MDVAEDIRRIALQEERLQFDRFGLSEAWAVGLALKAVGEAGRLPIVVDIRLATMKLLAFACPGARPTISTGRDASATWCCASTGPPTPSG